MFWLLDGLGRGIGKPASAPIFRHRLQVLAGLALLLAMVRTYAALHFWTGLGRHEMGVRRALLALFG